MTTDSNQLEDQYADAVAIIGMSCRFPNARTPDEFWRNLRDGVESVRVFTPQDLIAAGVDPAIMNFPNYVNSAVVLEGIELFDATFFGFNPRDAEILDPQQRIFLQCAWEALEDAGYDPGAYTGLIGVYAGADMSSYLFNLYSNPEIVGSVGLFAISLANDKDHVTTRVAYKLNLKGPAITIQTTCSTSLVATCQACQSLLYYQCDIALAGGTAIALPQGVGYIYQEGGIASPDGHCRAFDAAANGTIGGSGAGVVVLKRYADALADGDQIHAVIRGFGVNNDGALKVGYTAPSVEGQAEAIATAQAMAGVDPETITYIEAHGTGTPLGDPIEVAALTQVFRASTQKTGFCGIGSVKSNFGHLNSAAGVASIIKTVLALKHKMLPPSLHFTRPNPNIDFAGSPFYVVDRLREWQANGMPRRAGVSAFGIGGTNAHLIVEEAAAPPPPPPARSLQLLLLSAKSPGALDQATTNLGRHLRQHPDLALADVAYTLGVGRQAFAHRRMLLAANDEVDAAVQALETIDGQQLISGVRESARRPIIFMFSGQGAQHVHMGRELYEGEPAFREHIDRCCALLEPHLRLDLRDLIYGEATTAAAQRLGQTAITQPALFTIEYALSQLWMSWGIQPQAMVGHSIGEYVAACLSGVFSLEDALALVATRGQLMQQMPPGAMLVAHQSERDVAPLLDLGLSLAAINGPALCVVAGSLDAVARAEALLDQRGVNHSRLHTSHAFHSAMFDPIVEPFVERVGRVGLHAPRIPYLSNVTGTWITADLATDPSYWGRHLRQTVQFARCMEVLIQDSKRILLEVGPGKTLGTLAMQQGAHGKQMVLASLPNALERQTDVPAMLLALGQLWLGGAEVDWNGFYAHERRRRVSLPTYPFEPQRYWVEPYRGAAQAAQRAGTARSDIADWFYIPAWQQAPLAGHSVADRSRQQLRWLLLVDDGPLGAQLPAELERAGQDVITVAMGSAYQRENERSFRIDPSCRDDYLNLFKELRAGGKLPNQIVHLWSLAAGNPTLSSQRRQDIGFFSLLFLAQAIADQMASTPAQLRFVTSDACGITGQEALCPEQAMAVGACRVIAQELGSLATQTIDVTGLKPDGASWLAPLLAECAAEPALPVVALRSDGRWAPAYQHIRLESGLGKQLLRQGGVYLITGGLGGIGLALATYLARAVKARLVLVGRTSLPPPTEWRRWLASHDAQDAIGARIRVLLELEQLGAEIMVASVDVANAAQMADLATRVRERFGGLHGIIHSAGVAGGGIIQLKTVEQARRVLAPKVDGIQALAGAFGQDRLDFLVLCSSLSAQLGGFGQIDYSAANCYLNAFAQGNVFRRNGARTIAISWDTWAEVGMAVNTEVPDDLKQWQVEGLKRGIQTHEGVEAFERILAAAVSDIAVSTIDLPARIQQAIPQHANRAASAPQQTRAAGSHPRPRLSTAYVAPHNRSEEIIAGIWEELLGIQQIGVHDNFLELGGHSLLAIQLISRIRDVLQYEVSVQAFFDAPTVADLASRISGEELSGAKDEAEPPALDHLPRDRYRGRVSAEGVVELPDSLKKPSKGPSSEHS